MGGLVGLFQGLIVAYAGVPSFIVTLGGLLVWRGVAWSLSSGRTVAPMDSTFQLLGGGSRGSLGEVGSWIVGVLACLGIVAILLYDRRQRRRWRFRPPSAIMSLPVLGSLAVLEAVWAMHRSYPPDNVATQAAQEMRLPCPERTLPIPIGITYPALIALD